MCSGARRDGNALKAHPVVFTPNRLGDAGVRSEYPGSLVLDAVPREDGAIRVLVDPGLDNKDFRQFFYAHAWVEVATDAIRRHAAIIAMSRAEDRSAHGRELLAHKAETRSGLRRGTRVGNRGVSLRRTRPDGSGADNGPCVREERCTDIRRCESPIRNQGSRRGRSSPRASGKWPYRVRWASPHKRGGIRKSPEYREGKSQRVQTRTYQLQNISAKCTHFAIRFAEL